MSAPIDPSDDQAIRAAFTLAALASTDDPFAGMLAVARAVLPPGYVAVKETEIERLKQLVIDAGDAIENGGSAWNVVHDLYQPEWGCLDFSIPTESEEAR